MAQWNPNAPELVGYEWMAGKVGTDALFGTGTGLVQAIRSLGAEAVTQLSTRFGGVFGGWVVVDIYEDGDEIAGPVTTGTYRPTIDQVAINVQNQAGAGTPGLWQSLDDVLLDTSDYIRQAAVVSASIYSCGFGPGLTIWPTGRRVVEMRLVTRVLAQATTPNRYTPFIQSAAGTVQMAYATNYSPNQGIVTMTTKLGAENPMTGLPWTQAEMQELGSGGAATLSLPVVFELYPSGVPNYRAYQMYLEVDYVDENRVAVAAGPVSPGTPTSTITMANVRAPDTGVAGWAKANNRTYLYSARLGVAPTNPAAVPPLVMATAIGWVARPWLDSGTRPPLQLASDTRSYLANTSAGGGRISNLNPEVTRTWALVPGLPGTSETAQPFETITEFVLGSGVLPGPVLYFHALNQRVTATANRTVERVRFMARPVNEDAPDLYVYVLDAAYAVLDTITVTAATALASPNKGTASAPWYEIDAALSAPLAVTAATSYYISLSPQQGSFANFDGTFWSAPYHGAFTAAGAGTYLGGTDTAETGGPTLFVTADMPAFLSTTPAVPTGLAAALVDVDLPGDLGGCAIDEMQAVELSWDATADGLADYFEVQRLDDNDAEWRTIFYAEVTGASQVNEVTDYQAAQNLENCYRIRLVRTDTTVSEWTTEVCETPVMLDCGYLFVSNEDSTLNVGYTDGALGDSPEREYTILDTDRRVLVPLYGRDGQAVFRPTERLGDEFSIPCVVNAVETPTPLEGRWVLDLIVDLQLATIHDQAVVDETGRRWVVSLAVQPVTRKEPGKLYMAPVKCTTVSFVPIVTTVPAP